MNSEQLQQRIVEILEQKKGLDIQAIPVTEKTTLADYFIVVTGTSTPHTKSLADEVEYQLKTQDNRLPRHIEGEETGRWILLDYGDVIVHVFHPEERAFYRLDQLWKAAAPMGETLESDEMKAVESEA